MLLEFIKCPKSQTIESIFTIIDYLELYLPQKIVNFKIELSKNSNPNNWLLIFGDLRYLFSKFQIPIEIGKVEPARSSDYSLIFHLWKTVACQLILKNSKSIICPRKVHLAFIQTITVFMHVKNLYVSLIWDIY